PVLINRCNRGVRIVHRGQQIPAFVRECLPTCNGKIPLCTLKSQLSGIDCIFRVFDSLLEIVCVEFSDKVFQIIAFERIVLCCVYRLSSCRQHCCCLGLCSRQRLQCGNQSTLAIGGLRL